MHKKKKNFCRRIEKKKKNCFEICLLHCTWTLIPLLVPEGIMQNSSFSTSHCFMAYLRERSFSYSDLYRLYFSAIVANLYVTNLDM